MKYNFALFIIISALIVACNSKQKSIDTSKNLSPKITHSIIIYGSANCEHCVAFRKSADSVDVKYTFMDVEANETYFNELMQKIETAQYKGYVSFPVLDIDDKIYVRPEFDEFLKIIAE